jgi:hypothetical protein
MLAVRNGLPDSIFEDMNKIIYDTRYASEQIFIGNSIKAKMKFLRQNLDFLDHPSI